MATTLTQDAFSFDSLVDVMQEFDYTPADDCTDNDSLVAYYEMPTGLNTPDTITILATYYYDSNDFLVEIASSSYSYGCHNGRIGDMFYTFISWEGKVTTTQKLRQVLKSAKESATQFIAALNTMKSVKGHY